ncbi:B3 domain-containing protein At3g06220-like [Prosopis cineraria]|uniref:B3 domain-containing protein At3g06220-like n=1 Tax=Prosopis cineraria TaxID=364024 RepID=UPI00240F46AA|nr:B3 domain-containing protein At3g06220-like [Prosopis cineraria]
MDKQKNVGVQEYPEFFDVFLPKFNSERMRIPNDFVQSLRGRMLEKALLKSPRGMVWHVKIRDISGGMYFYHGWKQFIQDNSSEVGSFIVFQFDGSNTFKFKIYKTNRLEMIETYAEEEDGENDSAKEAEEEEYDDEGAYVKKEKDEQVNNRNRRRERFSLISVSHRGSSSKANQISLEEYGIDAEL